jgi:SAM-dependent methyltransferase
MARGEGRNHTYMLDRWKKKSASYPRYNSSEEVIEAEIVRSMKKAGIDFSGRTVLDVGCGTGVYTIRVAKEAKHVTGVDISKEMLEILEQDAAANGCDNLDILISPWDTFDAGGKKWDIVLSTMTPAVQLPEDYQKVRDSAKEAVIYLGWGGKRDVEPIKYIVGKSQVKPRVFNNSQNMRKWLEESGIEFYSEVFDEVRTKTMSFEEAVTYCQDELEISEVFALQNDIESELHRFTDENGIVNFKISVRLELIVYKK